MNQDNQENIENDNIHCRKASELISQSLDEPLSTRDQFLLKAHLSICKVCSMYNKQIMLLNDTFKKVPTDAELQYKHLQDSLSEEAMENMQKLIDENNE